MSGEPKFKVTIKTKGKDKTVQEYTIQVSDAKIAYTWGEKQAQGLELENPVIEVFPVKE